MLLANFNLANTCAPRAITCAQARVFGGINFADLVKNSPIHQIKSPQKFPAIRYCMLILYVDTVWRYCMAILYVDTVWRYCMLILYGDTVW